MKTKPALLTCLIVSGAIGVMLFSPINAEASKGYGRGHGKHSYKQHRKQHSSYYSPHYFSRSFSHIFSSFPKKFVTITVGSAIFHYQEGQYYRDTPHGYVSVEAPIGACISRLPHGYRSIRINGVKYYMYNDVFYTHTSLGYQVVGNPILSFMEGRR